jgi:hypothetical protein
MTTSDLEKHTAETSTDARLVGWPIETPISDTVVMVPCYGQAGSNPKGRVADHSSRISSITSQNAVSRQLDEALKGSRISSALSTIYSKWTGRN